VLCIYKYVRQEYSNKNRQNVLNKPIHGHKSAFQPRAINKTTKNDNNKHVAKQQISLAPYFGEHEIASLWHGKCSLFFGGKISGEICFSRRADKSLSHVLMLAHMREFYFWRLAVKRGCGGGGMYRDFFVAGKKNRYHCEN
jgi:hypothetical protein